MSARAPKKASKTKVTVLTDIMAMSSDREKMKEELQARLILDPPVYGSVPDSDPKIEFHRVAIGIKNPDGTEGDLIADFDRCFSYGTNINTSQDANKVVQGYGTAITMYDREGGTERQVRTVQFIEVLSQIITEHMLTEESTRPC